jgi:hypothetical protein
MSKEPYEHCSVCDGEGEIPEGKFGGQYQRTPTAPGMLECPGCGGERFVKVGMSIRRLEED